MLVSQNIYRITRSNPYKAGKLVWFFRPAFISRLPKRKPMCFVTGAAVLQLVITVLGGPAWQCPIFSAFAIPCPGCGLSTAVTLFMRGEWQAAFYKHAFAPVFLAAIMILGILSLMPDRLYRAGIGRLAALAGNYGFAGLFLISFIGYWGIRLLGSM